LEDKPGHPRATNFGLGIDSSKLFPIPGNHDKHLSTSLGGFEESSFCQKIKNNTFHDYRKFDYERSLVINNQPFIIFGLDSNYYQDIVLAEGEISREQENWVGLRMDFYKKNGVKGDDSSFPFDDAVKILLIHHCPTNITPESINWLAPKNYIRRFNYRSHSIRNDKEVSGFIKNNFDLIFCGHLHKNHSELMDGKSPILIMAGTASEWTDPEEKSEYNSFNYIQIYSSKKIGLTVFTNQNHFNRFEPEDTEFYNIV